MEACTKLGELKGRAEVTELRGILGKEIQERSTRHVRGRKETVDVGVEREKEQKEGEKSFFYAVHGCLSDIENLDVTSFLCSSDSVFCSLIIYFLFFGRPH